MGKIMKDLAIEFSLPVPFIVSTNDMYFHVPMKSKRRNGLTTHAVKTEPLKQFQEYMSTELSSTLEKYNDTILLMREIIKNGYHGISIASVFSMPFENYNGNDTTNCIKAYEDCVSRAIGIDDKNNLSYSAMKVCSGTNLWSVTTSMHLIPKDYEYISKVSTWCQECCQNTKSLTLFSSGQKAIACANCGTNKFLFPYSDDPSFRLKNPRCDVCNGVVVELDDKTLKCINCGQLYLNVEENE